MQKKNNHHFYIFLGLLENCSEVSHNICLHCIFFLPSLCIWVLIYTAKQMPLYELDPLLHLEST